MKGTGTDDSTATRSTFILTLSAKNQNKAGKITNFYLDQSELLKFPGVNHSWSINFYASLGKLSSLITLHVHHYRNHRAFPVFGWRLFRLAGLF